MSEIATQVETGIDTSGTPEEKLARLEAILRGYGRAIVAYSGGVDSTFLSVIAGKVLGENAVAVTAQSESLAPEELDEATKVAHDLGFKHLIIRTHELSDERYASNPLNRCFFCKTELMTRLVEFAQSQGGEPPLIALGAIVDDLGDFRPGETAARERGAVFPLRDAGLTKADIRHLSQAMGLPTWDKPGAACLSSRIPFGERVTPEKLSQIARGEYHLHALGFRECRLRHHGSIARVEVPVEALSAVLERRAEIVSELRKLGFAHVTLDLAGLHSGGLVAAEMAKRSVSE